MTNEKSIRKLYDSFELKDMSWDDFLKEFVAASSPPSMKEMMAVQMEKARADSAAINANRKQGQIILN
ncbi:MAG TPA: hypothetical protein ENH82_07345 [bacterium]|nr:hypothetical protein [bacterium]